MIAPSGFSLRQSLEVKLFQLSKSSRVKFEFYILYDAFEYIAPILAKAYFSGTTEEYYLSLHAVFAKWCMFLAGNERCLPHATFIKIRLGKNLKIFLGASIEGAGRLKGAIQVARWRWAKGKRDSD